MKIFYLMFVLAIGLDIIIALYQLRKLSFRDLSNFPKVTAIKLYM